MPRSLSFRNALAAITMAVAALCGGGKAAAQQKGTLSVVEITGDAALRPEHRKSAVAFLRGWLRLNGQQDSDVHEAEDGTLAVWTPGDPGEALDGLPAPATIGLHEVLAGPGAPPPPDAPENALSAPGEDGEYLLRPDPVVANDGIASAVAEADNYSGRPAISVKLTEPAARAFGDLTKASIGKPIAIVVDGAVVSAPIVREPITGGALYVSGASGLRETQRLALRLTAPPEGTEFVVQRSCTAARPRAPPIWGPKWFAAAPACDE